MSEEQQYVNCPDCGKRWQIRTEHAVAICKYGKCIGCLVANKDEFYAGHLHVIEGEQKTDTVKASTQYSGKDIVKGLAAADSEAIARRRALEMSAAYLGQDVEDIEAFQDEAESRGKGFWGFAKKGGMRSEFMHWWKDGSKGGAACFSSIAPFLGVNQLQAPPSEHIRCQDCYAKWLGSCTPHDEPDDAMIAAGLSAPGRAYEKIRKIMRKNQDKDLLKLTAELEYQLRELWLKVERALIIRETGAQV